MIRMLIKSGTKTSEFWLSVLALVLPAVADLGNDNVTAWAAGRGWIGALVVAVYVAARAYVKGQTAKAIAANPEPVPAVLPDASRVTVPLPYPGGNTAGAYVPPAGDNYRP